MAKKNLEKSRNDEGPSVLFPNLNDFDRILMRKLIIIVKSQNLIL